MNFNQVFILLWWFGVPSDTITIKCTLHMSFACFLCQVSQRRQMVSRGDGHSFRCTGRD